MSRHPLCKVLGVFIIGSILAVLLCVSIRVHKLYFNIYRLSVYQISDSMSNVIPQCTKISDCKLLPGDILIRRYITQRTRLIDKLAHPYFTHSAFYLGNDQIIEAVGTEKNPIDDIQIAKLSTSDWMNTDIESFVIVRPSYSPRQLNSMEIDLQSIAKDPDYIFGLPKLGYKRTTCADLILKELLTENVVTAQKVPWIITPDFLFSLASENRSSFNIVGYYFTK